MNIAYGILEKISNDKFLNGPHFLSPCEEILQTS